MKKRLYFMVVAFILLLAGICQAAGSCTQSMTNFPDAKVRVVKYVCTGDAADGSIPNTATSSAVTSYIADHYLYTVAAYPTSGGTAPDAADVFILDASGEDLLGSTDGGTTANKGANLIHATLKKTSLPYTHYLSMHYYPIMTGALTLKVSNQATASANYTIELTFVR